MCLATVHHVGVDIVVRLTGVRGKDIIARSEVALVDSGTRAAPRLDPLTTEAPKHTLGRWPLVRVLVKHRLDDVVHGVDVEALGHELWCTCEFLGRTGDGLYSDGRHGVVVGVRHQEAVHRGARALRNRVTM